MTGDEPPAGRVDGRRSGRDRVTRHDDPSRSGRSGPADRVERPNVFVLTADSLRADVAREKMSGLSELVDGVRFRQAVATANATAHSIPSMAFGVYRDAVGPALETRAVTTLAEQLRREGYRTSLWTDNRAFGPVRNFDRGFSNAVGNDNTWRQTAQQLVERTGSPRLFDAAQAAYFRVVRPLAGVVGEDHHYPPAADLHDRALEDIRAASSHPRPQLHWLHYMDTHHPFEPPQAYLDGRSFNGSSDRHVVGDLSSRAMISNLGAGLTRDDLEDVWEAYLASCDYWFDETSGFLEVLLDEGHFVPDRDVLVISSDHGESFDVDAHGILGHTPTPAFWEDLIRVPLLIAHPEWSPETVTEQVSLIDLMPTVLQAVGASIPDSAVGRAARAPADLAREFAFLTAQGPERMYHGVRWERGYKLFPTRVRVTEGNEFMAGDDAPDRERVVLSRVDDGEETVAFEHDLDDVTARPSDPGTAEVYERLLERLADERGGLVDDEERQLDDAIEAQLRNLGYVDDI